MYIRVRSADIFYETVGRGEPVLLLHGGFGSNDDFREQIPLLARHFRVVAFERPGHGHTADTEEPFSFETMASYTVGLIERLELGPTNLIGWSDGAITSLYVTLGRPDLVKRLISVGGSFDTTLATTPEAEEWTRNLTPESFKKLAPVLVERYEKASPDGPAHFAAIVEKTKKLWLSEPHISREALERISTPTLVMVADHDAVPIEHTVDLFRSIKNAQLCIVPGASHFLLSEKPEETTSPILRFLSQKTKPVK